MGNKILVRVKERTATGECCVAAGGNEVTECCVLLL